MPSFFPRAEQGERAQETSGRAQSQSCGRAAGQGSFGAPRRERARRPSGRTAAAQRPASSQGLTGRVAPFYEMTMWLK